MAKHLKTMSKASRNRVRSYFDTIKDSEIESQSDYWSTRNPDTHQEVKNRWLFAFASVHTTWTNNVNQYEQVKDKPLCNYSRLLSRLIIGGGGMYNLKAQGMFHFGCTWRYDHTKFTNKPENWVQARNSIAKELIQLNKAKTSFAYEMTWPLETQVVCLDRHILRLYGQDPEKAPNQTNYDWMENYWVKLSKERQVPPYIARCIYWDRINNSTTSNYWAYIL
jgi:hypothetical protein